MLRAVLDPNVLVSALLSREGTPARLLRRWRAGELDVVVSELLLDELVRVLAYPKLAERIPLAARHSLMQLLLREATVADDAPDAPARARDPGDDYLLALAEARRAILVSGDGDLLALAERYPVWTAAAVDAELDRRAGLLR